MVKKLITFFIYTFISIWLIWANANFEFPNSTNLQNTAIAFTLAYAFFKLILRYFIERNISDYKQRYNFRKAIGLAHILVLVLILVTIWAESVQALLVAYGLIAAGVALALQDVFKNFAGGVLLFTKSLYRVGDRIEIDGKRGDVIDIGIFNTTVLEISNWINGDQTTGRLINIPNGYILSNVIFNFTKDNLIIWDEIMIPITYKSSWRRFEQKVMVLASRITQEYQDTAKNEISKLSSKYYLDAREAKPTIYVKPTDNWIEIYLRYVTLARERRETKNNLFKEILEIIDADNNIEIASTTLDIIGFPKEKGSTNPSVILD